MKKILLLIILGLFLAFPTYAHHSVFHFWGGEVVQEVEVMGLGDAALIENRGFSLGLVILAGVIDGTNICGLSLMLLLAGYLAVHIKERRRSMRIGFVLLVTILLSYIVIGSFLASVVQSLLQWQGFGVARMIFNSTLVLFIATAGLLNVQDFFFSKKFFFEIDHDARKLFRKYLKTVDYPGTVVLGVAASLFLLPCSLPLYLSSVGVLAQTFPFAQTFLYVVIYCIFFTLPLLAMVTIILRAEKTVRERDIHSGKFRWLKLVKGGIQIAAAVGLYLIV